MKYYITHSLYSACCLIFLKTYAYLIQIYTDLILRYTKQYLFGLRYKVYEEKTHCQKCKKIFAIDARLNFNLYGTRTYLLFLN